MSKEEEGEAGHYGKPLSSADAIVQDYSRWSPNADSWESGGRFWMWGMPGSHLPREHTGNQLAWHSWGIETIQHDYMGTIYLIK